MKISNVASIVNTKIDASILTTHTYISTECMLPNCGGIENCSSIPNGKVTSFDKNDILLSNIRPYFKKLWFSTRSGGCSNDVICLRVANRECLPKYLYYALCTDEFIDSFSASSKGTKMPRGDKNALLTYEIPDRNIEDQLHIVDILGTLDSKIEDNDKENMHLENLFYQLWVKHFQNKSFEKLPLGSVLNIKYGRNLPTTQLQNTGYVVYGGNGTIGFFSSYMYEKPKVLVSCRGAASGNVIFSQPYSFITNNSLILEDNLNITYPYLRGLVKDLHFEKYTTGSAQPQITIDNISSIEIPVPPIELQSNFEIVIQPILDKLEYLRTNNEKLNELKTLYLIKFFG